MIKSSCLTHDKGGQISLDKGTKMKEKYFKKSIDIISASAKGSLSIKPTDIK